MKRETTYRKTATTRYTFTEDEIKWALVAQYMESDMVRTVQFCIRDDLETGYSAQIVVERTVGLDDSGIVHIAT